MEEVKHDIKHEQHVKHEKHIKQEGGRGVQVMPNLQSVENNVIYWPKVEIEEEEQKSN